MDYSELNEILKSTSTNSDAEAALAVLGVFIVFILGIVLIAAIFKIISRWIFFKKCGEEGWKSLIPIYTDLTLLNVAKLNWWWIFILLAGSILSMFQSSINISTATDSSVQLGVAAVLVRFLSIFASLAAIFARINISYNISKKFNKNGGYAVLIFLFEPIMFLVLGLSKNVKYDEAVEVSPNGIFGISTSKQSVYCPDCGTEVKQDFCPNCGKKVR